MLSERLKRIGARVDARRAHEPDPIGYTTYYLDAYITHLEDPPILREAYARAASWRGMALTLDPDARMVGDLCHERYSNELVYFYYGRGTTIDAARLAANCAAGRVSPELETKLEAVRMHAYGDWPADQATEAERLSQRSGAAWAQTWAGHLVLDYALLLEKGWGGLAQRVKAWADRKGNRDTETAAFYQAMAVTIDAAMDLWRRYADLCEIGQSGETDAERRRELAAMAERCLHLAHGPARDFRDAIQMIWLLHALSGADSVGRFDQYLGPYYAHDIADDALTREEALELIAEFWLKMACIGLIQNLTIGGQTPSGEDATNPVTYLALEATRLLGRPHPNLCLRLHAESPRRLWEAAMETIAGGTGTPALYQDAPAISGLIRLGIPEAEARDYCPAGCSQTVVPGRAHFMNDAGVYNAAKVLDLVLHDGYDTRLEVQVGPHTGQPEALNSYEQLEEAVHRQLAYFAEMEAAVNNLNYRHFAATEGYALRSLFTRDCVARGRSIWHGGARYNGIQLEIPGLTNLADSLAAIQDLVYEQQLITLPELVAILDADWEGGQALRAAAQAAPKFGNDDPRVDRIRARLTVYLYQALREQPAAGGGRYIPGEVIFVYHEGGGHQTGATPDGRQAGQILADSAGAAQGQDQRGPTALMRSVAALPHDFGTTSIVLNLKFDRVLFDTAGERARLIDLVQGYFALGGLQVQINVLDHQALLDAQANPAAFTDLVVRVGGFSAYFTTLSRDLQDDIIARTMHA